MILIIDGYNIIHAIKRFESKLDIALRTARDSFISFCAELAARRNDIEKICIVFDGASDLYCSEENPHSKVRVVYSTSGEDADDRIIEILESHLGKSQVGVVTNDNYVANSARAFQAKVFSASQFEDFFAPSKFASTKKSGILPSAQKVAVSIAQSITEEYKKFLGLK